MELLKSLNFQLNHNISDFTFSLENLVHWLWRILQGTGIALFK